MFEEMPTDKQFECIRELNGGLVNLWSIEFAENDGTLSAETRQDIQRIADTIGAECLALFLPKAFRHFLQNQYATNS